MKKLFSVLFTVVLVVSLGLVTASPALADTIRHVPSVYPTIQAALNASEDGDTIMVAAGEYDAFVVEGKANISIISTEEATVTTAASYWVQLGSYLTYTHIMALVKDSENINIEGIDFDGTEVTGDQVCGIFYLDSTGRIAVLTVENVIGTYESGYGVVTQTDLGTSTVEITGSTISENDFGIVVFTGSTLEAHFNNIVYNSWGLSVNEGGVTVDVTHNWWGDASGPDHESRNPSGSGDVIYDPLNNVVFEPWLESTSVTQTVTDDIVDAIDEADTIVEVHNGTATVTIFKYEGNPYPEAQIEEGGEGELASLNVGTLQTDSVPVEDLFRDVKVTNSTVGTCIRIKIYYTDEQIEGIDDEDTLRACWTNKVDPPPQYYLKCSTSSVVTAPQYNIDGKNYSGYIVAIVNDDSSPNMDQLNGTTFGGYGSGPDVPTPGCGPCFIATAAYGTDTAQEIDILREFRDTVLLPNSLGAKFVSFYYNTSPPIANFISQNEVLRTAVRVCFIDPIVKILTWTHGLWSP